MTHLRRQPIDVDRARDQHEAYERCLQSLDCRVQRLSGGSALPDSVFVEDTAVVLDEVAIIARLGAAARRGEAVAVEKALGHHRKVIRLETPATLDGGDVFRVGREIFVGLSSRTNHAALEQLDTILTPLDYQLYGIPVTGCLHLKSAVTPVADRVLLVNSEWVDVKSFRSFEIIDVDPSEPFGANALRVGGAVVYPTDHTKTARRLSERSIEVRTVDVSELAKAEGGITCCSLIFRP